MPIFIRMRLEAARFAQRLRLSLLDGKDTWRLAEQATDLEASRGIHAAPPTTSLTIRNEAAGFTIHLRPRCVRLFDAIYVTHQSAEIWLPLVSRIRLRNAARFHLAREANAQWDRTHE